jgi:dTDP-4-dehydrorhamnose 3,5-epimerase-like enzyme
MPLSNVKLIQLPKISDPRGNLTFLENSRHIPFDIKRVFFIYDIPSGQNRGAHAHQQLEQFIICLAGSLDVLVDDGSEQKTIHLNRPWMGLYVPPMVWASEGNFDPGTTYLVLASDFYNESDYYRDYDEFLKAVKT